MSLKLLPTDVAGMIVAQQDVPFVLGLCEAADLVSAPVDNACSLRPPAKRVCSGVQRIVKNLHDAVIGGRLPDKFANVNVAQDNGHLDAADRSHKNTCRALPNSRNFRKPPGSCRPLYMLVGIDLDLACFTPAQAGRQHSNRNSPRFAFEIAGRDTALSHQAQLVL